MPDEIVPATADAAAPSAPAEPAPAAPEDAAPADPAPHPLQPGGVRFEEVYGKWKAAEAERALLREELERERTVKAEAATKAATPPTFTVEQIRAALDAGQIDTTTASYYFAVQAKEQAIQEFEARQRVSRAVEDVQAYRAKVPGLADPTSETYQQVATTARELAAEMNRPVTDPIVQRRAVQMVVGPIEKVGARARAAEVDRQRSDPGGVLTPGSGGGPAPKADPLRGIPTQFREYHARQGADAAKIRSYWDRLSPKQQTRLGG